MAIEKPLQGIKFHLGTYKVEILVNSHGLTRRMTIESEDDCVGFHPDELIDALMIDVENLRELAKRCVADAKKERDDEGS